MSFENNDHQTNSNHMTNYNRRQFLGVLGAGAVASTGLSQPVSAQETPVVKMGNNYFETDWAPHRTRHDRSLRDSSRYTLGNGLREPDSVRRQRIR